MRLWVLYHAGCYDGFGAAWVAKRFHDSILQQPKFVAMNYGDSMPDVHDGDRVFFLDYSRKRDELAVLGTRCSVTVIDHHKTAEEDLREPIPAVETFFDMNKSGASLAWDFFFNRQPIPELLKYIEDRDLWRWALPHSQEVTSWLRSYAFDFKLWDKLAEEVETNLNDVVREGRAIQRFTDQMVDHICRHARTIQIDGHAVPVANSSVFMSEVGARLCELHPDAPFGAYYFDREDGLRQWGMRAKDFDVSDVAKKYGGGGHRLAAGFQTDAPEVIPQT